MSNQGKPVKDIEQLIFDKNFGKIMSKARKELGITNMEMAKCLGVTHQQIHKYELGMSSIRIPRALKIMKILNIKLRIQDLNNMFKDDLIIPDGMLPRRTMNKIKRLSEDNKKIVIALVEGLTFQKWGKKERR